MKIALMTLLLVVASHSCFADTKNLTPMKIHLPDEMAEVLKKETTGVYMYIYNSSTLQLKIVVLDKAPNVESENAAWQTELLGKQIALWREGSVLPLDQQTKVLNEKPKSEQFGKYAFKSVEMSFATEDVKFMNTVSDHASYMFTIISNAKDLKQRKAEMTKMSEVLNKMELKPLPLL